VLAIGLLSWMLIWMTQQAQTLRHQIHSSVESALSDNASRNKAKCPQCGYEVTLLKKWADYGAPICPKDTIRMEQVGNDVLTNESDEDQENIQKLKEIRRAVSKNDK
jgi:hypothetical protein